jgi:hypothetical protein
MYSENLEERTKQLNDEKKREFVRFALTYFNSFSWKVESVAIDQILAKSPLNEPYMIIPVVQGQETYPTYAGIASINTLNRKVLVISEEFGQPCPLKGNKKYSLIKHTASGLQFCYLKLKDKNEKSN